MSDWLGWLVAIFIAVVAIRGTFKFDLNQWLKYRREARKEAIRALCPHARIVTDGGQVAVKSDYISPYGTTAYQCQSCGKITHDRSAPEQELRYWCSHLDELADRYKQMDKLSRKLGA